MTLQENEIGRLAAVMARHFTTWDDRSEIARKARLLEVQLSGPSRDVWAHILREANEQGKVDKVLRAAAVRKPDVRRLMKYAQAAEAGTLKVPSPWIPRFAALAAVSGTVGLASVIMVEPANEDGVQAGANEVEVAQAEVAPEPVVPPEVHVDDPAEEPTAAEPVAEPEPAAVPEPVVEPEPTPAPVREEPKAQPKPAPSKPAPVRTASAPTTSVEAARTPCARVKGSDLLGYAYAGMGEPKIQDGSWVVGRSVYVRSEYPNRTNDWALNAPATCTVAAGQRVRLKDSPIPVDGGATWIPVYAGSVLVD